MYVKVVSSMIKKSTFPVKGGFFYGDFSVLLVAYAASKLGIPLF
ncbi:hypothetical protein BT246_72180 (plasmid) [Bacillus thuringiensis]|uniref:Uncharacterized protein n=1 Tax=Bacillus thuringiensis TaxID=1428 RepID=A0A9W3SK27_BACTU|nr:hypothetical protein [Bacillus thuringiensis]ANS52507.1 hypothetical protein BT246_72180 [Bacillus thuringiensis]